MEQALFLNLKDKVPKQDQLLLRDMLKGVSKEKQDELMIFPLKDPKLGLILSVCFGIFSVDRFYKGDIGIAVARLIISIGCILMYIAATINKDDEMFISFFIAWGIAAIWGIIDIFLVYKGIKKENIKILTNLLGNY